VPKSPVCHFGRCSGLWRRHETKTIPKNNHVGIVCDGAVGAGHVDNLPVKNMTRLVLNVIYIGHYHSGKEYYMKQIFTFFLFILLAAAVFAAPSAEVDAEAPTPIEISILYSGVADLGDLGTNIGWAISRVKEDFPGATITELQIDLADGSAMTMTALLASGQAPNVYMDYIGRASSYIVADYALPLDRFVHDLDQYPVETLAPYRRNGNLLALPQPGSAQGMAINLELMADIGYDVPDNWTIADFLEMAELVKQKYGGSKWATGMFAGNMSGDYLINNWFAAFGADFYASGDYSKTTIASTGGAAVHEFFQLLMHEGYIRGDAATQVDDDYVLDWAKGDLAATAFFQPWIKPYFDVVAKQGYAPFDYKFVPFPRGPGVDFVPTYNSCAAMVVHETGTDEDAVAARMVEYLNSAEIQTAAVLIQGVLANRKDVTVSPTDEWTAQIQGIVRSNGLFDVGITNPRYMAARAQHFPVLQRVLNMEMTPADSIAAYEKALNEALK